MRSLALPWTAHLIDAGKARDFKDLYSGPAPLDYRLARCGHLWAGAAKEESMLRDVTDLRGYAIRATDGVIGHVDDVYFDDQNWGIRYLVVNTGNWLSGRKVLISPIALGHAGWMARQLPVAMT